MNPLQTLFDAGLPELDFGVMKHGFADHGRDYIFIIEDSSAGRLGTYRLTFTHVVELNLKTTVSPQVWTSSWSDDFIDYQQWEAAGEPNGYVFGTNWSLAYPGVAAIHDDPSADKWANMLGRPMFAASIETDRFDLHLVFHDVQLEQLGPDAPTVSQVFTPFE